MLLEKSVLGTWRSNSRNSEWMKQSEDSAQLWVWLVVVAKPSAVKSNIAQEPVMSGP